MTSELAILSLTGILVLGIAAQWLAWRAHLPAILLLLLVGLAVGPGARAAFGPDTPFLNPDLLLGHLLNPLVSLAVCVILYEGGLTLKLREIKQTGGVVRNLVTVGVLVTWILSSLLAHLLLGFSFKRALLVGSILVVTGPTVIGPLLHHVRPRGAVASVLKWEGIVIDPIGALLAVLVYEAIHVHGSPGLILKSIVVTALLGTVLGVLGARLLVFAIDRHLIPNVLDNAASLALVMGLFTLSNEIQEESGLLTATVMGIALANQRTAPVRHLVEFKENLRVLLISSLFVVLAAKLEWRHLQELSRPGSIEFVILLILVVRPVSAWISTARSTLTRAERLYVAFLAPRGIVAAAVASQLALTLGSGDAPDPDAERLVAVTFLVIIATVLFYGLTAAPIAYRLGLADRNPQGVLIVGAHPWARELAKTIKEFGFRALLLDINAQNVAEARAMGLEADQANALSDHVLEDLDLGGIGRAVALTGNDETNTLVGEHLLELFGRSEVYRAAPRREGTGVLRAQVLFDSGETVTRIYERRDGGAAFLQGEPFKAAVSGRQLPKSTADALPLFVVDAAKKRLRFFVAGAPPSPQAGDIIVSYAEAGEDGSPEA